MELTLSRRINKVLGNWPPSLAKDFRRYFRHLDDNRYSGEEFKSTNSNYPYWVLLPSWLSSVYSKRLTKSQGWSGFLAQINWAQYCLFLFLRIQDDLYDGDANQISLMFVSDQLLMEADQTLSNYFDRKSEFWRIYRDRIQKATRSLVNLDELQKKLSAQPRRLLKCYAEVSSILQLGAIATCLRAGRFLDLPRVTAFSDALATAGQLLDDLQDLEEDLKRGRFNFAAISLIGPRRNVSPKRTLERLIAHGIIVRGGATNIISEIYKQIRLAEWVLAPLQIKEANDYLRNYEESIGKIENVIHRLRVRYIFGY